MPGLLRILILLIVIPFSVTAKSLNGFDLSNATVPLKLILSGGPPKDGIPALTDPKMLKGKEATYLESDDVILGLVIAGEARAYPLRILNWHEIVNDKIAGGRYVVSYCPLCGSGMAFKAEPKSFSKRSLNFGVSGLLYSSDVLMYDSETESLWSQIHGEAVSGKLVGTSLEQIPMSLDLWGNWMARNPDTLVLSTDTGFRRDYSRDPYAGYAKTPAIYFPVANQAPKAYHPKEMVLGLKGKVFQVAFPFKEIERLGESEFKYQFEGKQYLIHWDKNTRSAWISNSKGETVPSTLLYWFAWYAFYPETEIFKASQS
ncbi:DUF3179 domain-containing protein [Vibrio ishigakensis]|nr:DUF3179 domain-containing protein [Vibrio ishigakensis]